MTEKANIKRFAAIMLPVSISAVGLFFSGYRFSSDSLMSVENGLLLMSRAMAFAAVLTVFSLTTERVMLVRSLNRNLHIPDVYAYGLLAACGIFPYAVREIKITKAALRCRGIRAFTLSPMVMKSVLRKSVGWAESLSTAMESKGFDDTGNRTDYVKMSVCAKDIAVSAAVVLIPIVIYKTMRF